MEPDMVKFGKDVGPANVIGGIEKPVSGTVVPGLKAGNDIGGMPAIPCKGGKGPVIDPKFGNVVWGGNAAPTKGD